MHKVNGKNFLLRSTCLVEFAVPILDVLPINPNTRYMIKAEINKKLEKQCEGSKYKLKPLEHTRIQKEKLEFPKIQNLKQLL